jgi:hypothetical protein
MPKGIPGSHSLCSAPGCGNLAKAQGLCKERHYDRWRRLGTIDLPSAEQRFLSRIRELANGCWQWDEAGLNGYGRFSDAGRRPYAHRWAYQYFIGPIPEGWQIDHRCHNEDPSCLGGKTCQHRRCVNPRHLVAATQRDNLLRGKGFPGHQSRQTHCKRGHLFDAANTIIETGGKRKCRTCKRARERK